MALPDVLIADDDQLICAMIRDALADVPCTVRTVDSGEAALAELQKRAPAVLVVDLVMPGKSGLEVLHEVRQRKLPTRVLVVSSLDVEALVRTAMADGAHGFLSKPLHRLEVQSMVRGALEAAAAGGA